MGPNVKFVSPISDLIFERKNRGNFFIRKKTIRNTDFFSGTLPLQICILDAYNQQFVILDFISLSIYETQFQDLCGDEKKAIAEKHPTTKFVL